MTKNFLSLVSLAVLWGILFSIQSSIHIPTSEQLPKGNPAHPGWYEQVKRMKGDIPFGIASRIAQQQQVRDQDTSILLNVTELGPDNVGGRTRALIFDYTNNQRILAGGISGGLWESLDRGDTWMPLNDQAPTLSITSIVQDPFDSQTFYYGTGEPRGNSAGIPGDGVYKSTDGGQTFAKLAATDDEDFEEIWFVACDPSQQDVLYVATHGAGVFRSEDGGTSFEKVVVEGSGSATALCVFPDGSVMVGFNGVGIYTSATGDLGSFTRLTNGLPADSYERIAIDYCRDVPGVVYAQFEAESGSNILGIWRSIDGGQSWLQAATPNGGYLFPWYAFMLAVQPDDPNTVYTGCVDPYITTNGGQSWVKIYDTHADYHVVAFDPQAADRVLIGNDGGVYEYRRSTAVFTAQDLNEGYNVTQFYAGSYFPTGDDVLGGTQDNGTHRGFSTDFDKVFGADGSFNLVNQQAPFFSFLSYQYGNVFRSSNSLDPNPNYQRILDLEDDLNEDAWFINPFTASPANNTQLFIVTQERVWRSSDNGDSWSPIMNPLPGGSPYALGISKDPNPTLYVGGDAMLFYRVDQAGNASPGDETPLTFSSPPAADGSFISDITLHPDTNNILYVALSDYNSNPRAYRVDEADGAQPIWTSISGDLPLELPANSIVPDPSHPDSVIILGTDFGLYVTTDAGNTWVQDTRFPNVPIAQVEIRESDRKLFVFTHGRGIWAADLPTPTTSINNSLNQQVRIFPNPVRDRLRFETQLDWSGQNISYQILNVEGKTIQTGSLRGTSSEIELANLPAGTYVLRLESKEGALQKKFVKFGE